MIELVDEELLTPVSRLPLRDVFNHPDCIEELARGISYGRASHAGPSATAVLALELAVRRVGVQVSSDLPREQLQILFQDQFIGGVPEVETDEFIPGMACKPAARLVDGYEQPVPVHLGNAYGGIFLSGTQARLALPEGRFPLLKLRRRGSQRMTHLVYFLQSGRCGGDGLALTNTLRQARQFLDRGCDALPEHASEKERQSDQDCSRSQKGPKGAAQGSLHDVGGHADERCPVRQPRAGEGPQHLGSLEVTTFPKTLCILDRAAELVRCEGSDKGLMLSGASHHAGRPINHGPHPRSWKVLGLQNVRNAPRLDSHG